MKTAPLLACVLLAGCLPAAEGTYQPVECEATSDCNAGAGEVCDVGVCWGDPPAGAFSAILVPPTALAGDLVMTGVPALTLSRDGWITDGTGAVTFDQGVAMAGRVTIPCPAALPACVDRQPLPGTIRWSRPSGFPGGPRLTGSAEVGVDGGYALVVTRPHADAAVTMTLSYTPSQVPLAPGLPSPAMLMAPYTEEVRLAASDIDVGSDKILRDLALDPARLRMVTGRIVRPLTAPVTGWQLQAEVVVEGTAGARQLVSTLAATDSDGNFTLRVATDHPIVDVVCAPPPTGAPLGESRPSVRARDVVVADLTGPMHDIMVPQLGLPTDVTFDVSGTDSSGGTIAVDGATVIIRLDHDLGNGLQLELDAQKITSGGFATMQLFPVLDGDPLPYTVDVLPGPASELASEYGALLTIGAQPTAIALPRRRSLVGRVLDAEGRPVAGAAVAASLSTATLCALSTSSARLARSLASTQIATNAKGEFTLFVDNDLAGVPLTYDVAVRPASGDGRPQWSFVELTPTVEGSRVDLQLPDSASVRGVVLSNDHGPVDGAALSVYEQVDGVPSCASSLGVAGTAVLRGLGTTDSTGTAPIVLPRPAAL